MSVTAAKLVAEVGVDGVQQSASAISGFGGMLGGLAVAGGAALIGLGVESVKMAGNFESSMVRLVTTAGESKSNLKQVSDGILNLAVQTGESSDQLATAMYHVESAGFHGADGLNVLRLAAEGAKAENADLTGVANALVGMMNSYHLSTNQASGAMNALIASVAGGNTTLQEMSSAMSQVAPQAAALGIPFADVAGAIDVMTSKSMSAQQASQNLAHVLVGLSAPSKGAETAMNNVGLSAQQVKDALVHQGLPEALQMIEDHVGKQFPEGSVKYNQALKNILGGLVGFKLAAQLTGSSLKDTEDRIKAISDSMKSAQKDIDGWSDVQGTLNFKISQLQEVFETLGIRIGTIFMPWVDKAIDVLVQFAMWLSNRIVPALQLMTDWINKYVGPVLQQFGKWITDTVLPILGQLWGWLSSKLGDAWSSFVKWITQTAIPALGSFWNYLATNVFPQLQKLWNWLSPQLGSAWSAFSGWISNTAIPALQNFWSWLNTNIFPVFQILWNWLSNTLHQAWIKFATDIGIPKGDMNDLGKSIKDLEGKFGDLQKSIQKTDDQFNQFMAPAIKGLGKALGDAQKAVGQLLSDLTGKNMDSAKSKSQDLNTIWQSIGQAFAMAAYAAVTAVALIVNIFTAGVNAIDQVIEGLKQTWKGICDYYQSAWKMAVDLITGKFSQLPGDFQNVVNSALEIVRGFINTLMGLLAGPFAIQIGVNETITQQQQSASQPNVSGPSTPVGGGTSGAGGHFASGTNYAPGGMSVVGENGPEIMYIPRGAQIISNNQLSQQGNQQQQIVVQAPSIYLDGRLIANGLLPQITNAIRYGTGINNY